MGASKNSASFLAPWNQQIRGGNISEYALYPVILDIYDPNIIWLVGSNYVKNQFVKSSQLKDGNTRSKTLNYQSAYANIIHVT